MSYASATAAYRPPLRGQRPAASRNPMRHLEHIEGLALLVDLKGIRPITTKQERADFVIKDLKVPAEDVILAYVDNISQMYVVTLETEAVHKAALERLRGGVPWTAAEGALVYGSASTEAISAVRVSNIPAGLKAADVVAHMQRFGAVLNHSLGRDRCYPRAGDGVLHLSMVLNDAERLPHFIDVVDSKGVVSHALSVHTDTPRRRCYRCGRNNHFGFGYRCQAASRAQDAPASTWSSCKLPPRPTGLSWLPKRPVAARLNSLPLPPPAAPNRRRRERKKL